MVGSCSRLRRTPAARSEEAPSPAATLFSGCVCGSCRSRPQGHGAGTAAGRTHTSWPRAHAQQSRPSGRTRVQRRARVLCYHSPSPSTHRKVLGSRVPSSLWRPFEASGPGRCSRRSQQTSDRGRWKTRLVHRRGRPRARQLMTTLRPLPHARRHEARPWSVSGQGTRQPALTEVV